MAGPVLRRLRGLQSGRHRLARVHLLRRGLEVPPGPVPRFQQAHVGDRDRLLGPGLAGAVERGGPDGVHEGGDPAPGGRRGRGHVRLVQLLRGRVGASHRGRPERRCRHRFPQRYTHPAGRALQLLRCAEEPVGGEHYRAHLDHENEHDLEHHQFQHHHSLQHHQQILLQDHILHCVWHFDHQCYHNRHLHKQNPHLHQDHHHHHLPDFHCEQHHERVLNRHIDSFIHNCIIGDCNSHLCDCNSHLCDLHRTINHLINCHQHHLIHSLVNHLIDCLLNNKIHQRNHRNQHRHRVQHHSSCRDNAGADTCS
mmetsp:Transcript_31196/g.74455  ORF Transcript_31196/g.74455 Transcript_31196/m.74455 type:complete len:310 (+) Transcript_31196:744-1673(+)